MKRILHTSVRIVTFVDPVTGDPYGHGREYKGRTYRNPARAAVRRMPYSKLNRAQRHIGRARRAALRFIRLMERQAQ